MSPSCTMAACFRPSVLGFTSLSSSALWIALVRDSPLFSATSRASRSTFKFFMLIAIRCSIYSSLYLCHYITQQAPGCRDASARPQFLPEFIEISLGERPKPAPASAQRAAATIEQEIRLRFAGQQGASQGLNQGRIGHDKRR